MPEQSPRPTTVTPRPLGDLLDRIPIARLSGAGDVAVRGITHDSRQVRPGDLYVARSGASTHGIDHVEAAVGAGAVAVLTDDDSESRAVAAGAAGVVVVPEPRRAMGPASSWAYGDPSRDLRLVGLTGTNGKTTTAYLVEAGLQAAGWRAGLIGTITTRIDGTDVPSARTTPEAPELQALFAVMRERGVMAVVMEVSSHALALDRVAGTSFDVAGFTNLSQDHLDFHGDLPGYFAAKAQLFTAPLSERAVVTIDDEWGRRLADTTTLPLVTTGTAADAQWRRAEGSVDASGGRTRLSGPGDRDVELRTRLSGSVNLANAALAFLCLVELGVDHDVAVEGIARCPGVPGRMERVDIGGDVVALVDYAHTPEAVRRLLSDARVLAAPGGRVVSVLGCGGDRDTAKRPLMGQAVAAGSDLAVLTSDNPRSEHPQAILDAMLSGVASRDGVRVEPDRAAAIRYALAATRPGDVLVVAGKGHETGQEVAGRVLPFDDRTELRRAAADPAGSVG